MRRSLRQSSGRWPAHEAWYFGGGSVMGSEGTARCEAGDNGALCEAAYA
jgi:hypothetical protein